MKNISTVVTMSLLLAIPVRTTCIDFSTAGKPAACVVGAVATCCALRAFATPEQFKPTLAASAVRTITPLVTSATTTSIYDYMESMGTNSCEQSQEVVISATKKCFVRADIGVNLVDVAPEQPVFIFSPSFLPVVLKHRKKFLFFPPSAPGRSLYTAGYYLSNKSLPTTCITFDYRDTRAALNVAQELDQRCLKMVTDEVVRQKHDYILFGVCRGSANLVTFLTQQPQEALQHVKAVIAASVPFSLKAISEQTMRALPILNLAPHRIGSELLYGFFRALFPNHRYQESNILERVENIPQDLPMLIIHVKSDSVAYDGNVQLLMQRLLETGHTKIHCLLLDNKELDHYTMSTAPVYPQAVNAFLQSYQLPHDADMAYKGREVIPAILQPLSCSPNTTIKQYIADMWNYDAVNPDGTPATKK